METSGFENAKIPFFKKIMCCQISNFFFLNLAQFIESGETPISMANVLPKFFCVV